MNLGKDSRIVVVVVVVVAVVVVVLCDSLYSQRGFEKATMNPQGRVES
jgi:hypothetical protein